MSAETPRRIHCETPTSPLVSSGIVTESRRGADADAATAKECAWTTLYVKDATRGRCSRVTVHHYGATVCAWTEHALDSPTVGEERLLKSHLFLSELSHVDGSRPLRGGIPLCFPQFGPGALPQHGFARNSTWQLAESVASDRSVSVSFRLKDNEHTRSLWPHSFETTLTVTLNGADKSTLTLQWSVRNSSCGSPSTAADAATTFSFTNCLHPYFAVHDVSKVRVRDVSNLLCRHKTRDNVEIRTDADEHELSFAAEVDVVCYDAPDVMNILEQGRPLMRVTKKGFSEFVIWNPWSEKAKAMSDFADDEYQRMVCLEPGVIRTPHSLAPGDSWTGVMLLEPSY
eukprot:CAMPEP_0177651978 /NCGR_PEP_ID=MMETSP0447-20121125/12854_1 /TAXON_ID=0 /ORGANISM="Stygamoeba regulata, Strain BSH-02190019" /LENGTH=342 /DNA_ID=CAMNT_0019155131 /DNA_START=56 /DNA_END=1084 /DNA_ORIENTATION=+